MQLFRPGFAIDLGDFGCQVAEGQTTRVVVPIRPNVLLQGTGEWPATLARFADLFNQLGPTLLAHIGFKICHTAP